MVPLPYTLAQRFMLVSAIIRSSKQTGKALQGLPQWRAHTGHRSTTVNTRCNGSQPALCTKPFNTSTTLPQTMYPGTTLHSTGTAAAPSQAEAAAAATSPGVSQPGNIWRPV